MNISYERNNFIQNSTLLNVDSEHNNIVIMGKAEASTKNGEILKPKNLDEARKLYGVSDLYDAYEQASNLGVENIYTINCFNTTDYLTAIDKLVHYNFAYIVPINLFLSDTFYDPINKEHRYYANFFIESLNEVDSLSTVIFTERHATLFDDIDHYLIGMKTILSKYTQNTNTNRKNPTILDEYGNDLVFVLNTLKDVEHSNVILASMLANSYPSEYPKNVGYETVCDIDKRDIEDFDMAYFKMTPLTDNSSIDNLLNQRNAKDIYKNVIIDNVIKHTIRSLDLSTFKGKMYNMYTRLQLENTTKTILDKLRGRLFKDYKVERIGFNNITVTSGYVYVEISIQPYGTFETVKVVMGV